MKPAPILLFLALAGATGFGCASQPFTASEEMVAVSDIKMVVGRWDGTAEKRPLLTERGPVSLTIREDFVYVFVGEDVREDRLLAGTGKLTIRDGRLYLEDDQRRATLTLQKRGKEDILAVEVINAVGKRFHIEFIRSPLPPLSRKGKEKTHA